MSATWNDTIDQSAALRRVLWYEDTAGVYLYLAGYGFTAELRASFATGDPIAVFTCEIIDNPEPSSVAGNEVLFDRALEITLTKEQTAALGDGVYTFELWSEAPSGERECDWSGLWRVNARGNRP